MAWIEMRHFSTALQRAIGLMLIVPEGEGPFPAVYQLHGLSDDHTIWHRRTAIERYAESHRLIVAMPDGGRSFYCNWPNGVERAEDHILETVALVDRTFRTIPERRARAIGGLSMGGYGALKLALKHPHLFCSVAAHSGALDLKAHMRTPERPRDLDTPYPHGLPASDDCFALARRLARSRGLRPAIRIDCGVDDFLLDQNRRCHAHLDRLGIAHEYEEFPGGHSWEYWDAHIDQALRFHLSAFAAAGKAYRRRPRR
jgi:S-formylglutathione hydrolase FrmB